MDNSEFVNIFKCIDSMQRDSAHYSFNEATHFIVFERALSRDLDSSCNITPIAVIQENVLMCFILSMEHQTQYILMLQSREHLHLIHEVFVIFLLGFYAFACESMVFELEFINSRLITPTDLILLHELLLNFTPKVRFRWLQSIFKQNAAVGVWTRAWAFWL